MSRKARQVLVVCIAVIVGGGLCRHGRDPDPCTCGR